MNMALFVAVNFLSLNMNANHSETNEQHIWPTNLSERPIWENKHEHTFMSTQSEHRLKIWTTNMSNKLSNKSEQQIWAKVWEPYLSNQYEQPIMSNQSAQQIWAANGSEFECGSDSESDLNQHGSESVYGSEFESGWSETAWPWMWEFEYGSESEYDLNLNGYESEYGSEYEYGSEFEYDLNMNLLLSWSRERPQVQGMWNHDPHRRPTISAEQAHTDSVWGSKICNIAFVHLTTQNSTINKIWIHKTQL
jgi:hypothetical protein